MFFFEEKTVGVSQFIIQSKEILENIYSEINRKLILQGLTIQKPTSEINNKIQRYINKIIKYIKKKESKKENKLNTT